MTVFGFELAATVCRLLVSATDSQSYAPESFGASILPLGQCPIFSRGAPADREGGCQVLFGRPF